MCDKEHGEMWDKAHDEMWDELKAERDQYKAALEFYANEDNWPTLGEWMSGEANSRINNDCGYIAKQALEVKDVD